MKKLFIFLFLAFYLLKAYSYDHLIESVNDTVQLNFRQYSYPIKLNFNTEYNDTVTLKYDREMLELILSTDKDSIDIQVKNGETKIIRVEKNGYHPADILFINKKEKYKLDFDTVSRDERIRFIYDYIPDNDYYRTLREKYLIDSIADKATGEIGKVRKISSWVQGLWQHDGDNQPKENNALYILDEVKKGKRFRCVEYGIVATACLNALGMPSRTLALKTKYVETGISGEGHVVMEVFLKDLNKWIMIDPQWDAIPHIHGFPLNAVELQEALNNESDVEFWSDNSTFDKDEYIKWIYPYLYYFDVKFDNRENIMADDRYKIAKRTNLMLVPKGAKEPKVFQRNFRLGFYFTNYLADFYKSPYINE